MRSATAIAHPNIALVKYWGKRDVALNLPAVPSVSLTLSGYRTRTTVTFGTDKDEVVLDGVPRDDARVARVLDLVAPGCGPARVVSDNDFPTAAGLASSASGFAALVVAAAEAAGRDLDRRALSAIARRGSGSACRSLWGGFVAWRMGTRSDGEDSVGEPIAAEDHWDLRLVVALVSEASKAVGSTEGMIRSAATSPYWDAWVALGAPLVGDACAAIAARDLDRLGAAMETSTFAMHATMHTASPPLIYWHPATVAVIAAVHALRSRGVAAYATMDAGPQVKILCAADDVDTVQQAVAPHAIRTDVHAPGKGARIVPDAPSEAP